MFATGFIWETFAFVPDVLFGNPCVPSVTTLLNGGLTFLIANALSLSLFKVLLSTVGETQDIDPNPPLKIR